MFRNAVRGLGVGRHIIMVAFCGVIGAGALFAFQKKDRSIPVVTGDARVDKLLSEMTLEEKVSLIHGGVEDASTSQAQAGYLPGIPRLRIPSLRLADGPPGVLTRIPSAAPTCTMGLAATFSREDARQNGIMIGREARARGIDVTLEPFINMDRDLTFKRSYNTFGEDPLLTGEIGAAQISGTQSQGVMCQAKHYAAFDTTWSLGPANITVDERALHEIYVAPFADAVKAGVASLMCAYSLVNGKYSCGNSDILITILRKELGFKGFVTSDWGATHATGFINEGLDMEMPGPVPYPVEPGKTQAYFPSYFAGNDLPLPVSHPIGEKSRVPRMPEEPSQLENLVPTPPPSPTDLLGAVKSGEVSEARITEAAGRVLYEMDKFGYLTNPPSHEISAIRTTDAAVTADAKIIQRTGEDAAVLLKNENDVLPLTKREMASLAMIGPTARQAVATGSPEEQARGLAVREIGPLEALRNDTAGNPDVHILYAVADDMTGTPIPAQFLSYDGKPGLLRTGITGNTTQIDPSIDFTHSNGQSLPANTSFEWKGTLNIPHSGIYRLHMQLLGAFGILRVDDKQMAEVGVQFIHGDVTQAVQDDLLPTTDGLDSIRVQLDLSEGPHAISLSLMPDSSNNPEEIRLNWLTPDQRKIDDEAAIAVARNSKTAIVFAWSRGSPSFALPDDQDKLIENIAAVNPNTIVVLNVSQPVAMPWLGNVKGVLQMWWPGDEGGWATANVLLGKISPAGRLPFTWPKRRRDTAVNDPAHPERQEGPDTKTVYSEGIFVGYRWFDKQGIEPLFPFGFGLSYTRFEYSRLHVSNTNDGGVDVSFNVKNAGAVASDEVPQVYLGAPAKDAKGVQFAVRALAAFDRIHLDSGQSKNVSLHVPPRSFQYWESSTRQWVTVRGSRTVYVGPSSRDLPLKVITEITH
jgi:beta-glucosidase